MKYIALPLAITALLAATVTPPSTGIRFTDVTSAAGIKFVHNSGRAGKKYLPETMGSGGAFVDLDTRLMPAFAAAALKVVNLIARPGASGTAALSSAIDRLGPSYVKLGQFLATRPDVAGALRGGADARGGWTPSRSSGRTRRGAHNGR